MGDKMVMLDRWIKIMDYLKQNDFATVQELMDTFNISISTVRRDLMAMEEQNLIKRTRGGAELINNEIATEPMLKKILDTNKEAKIKIAQKAATLINDNDFIFIDSGSTCYYIIDYIIAKNVTVVTNGIIHIQKLMKKDIKTYILGGDARPDLNLIIGEDTIKKIAMMNFNISFIGTMGIDSLGGFTTVALIDGDVKKTVIKSSKVCYVLADTSKFNVSKFYTYGDLTKATVITEHKVDFKDDRLNIIYADECNLI